MTNNKKIRITVLALFSACTLCLAGGIVGGLADAKASPQEAFYMPDYISKQTYLGQKTEIARIMPAQEDAVDYAYKVVKADTGESVATEGYSFLPEVAGEYKCIYYYTYGGEAQTYSYVINATAKETPVFTRQANYPNAFIGNLKYNVDALSAFDYTTGEKKEATVAITATCNGEAVEITNGVFKPTYKDEGSVVELKYVATYNGVNEEQTYKVPVVQVYQGTKVDMSGLFTATGVSKTTASEGGITFTASRNAKIDYANILHANAMRWTFGFGEHCEAERIVLDITSYLDPSINLTLAYDKGRQDFGAGSLILNGKTTREWSFKENEQHTVLFDALNGKFTAGDGTLLFEVDEDSNGGAFTGFPEGLVKVSLRMEGLYGTADLNVYQINSQVITNDTEDFVAPGLVLSDMNLEKSVGETVVISGFRAVDVLDPNATVEMQVRFNGVLVPTTQNADGSYSFVPTASGNYLMTFNTMDRSGNDGKYNKVIYVYEKEPPVLTVKGEIPTKVKVNDVVKVADATATDNEMGESVRIQIVMLTPTAAMNLIAEGVNGEVVGANFTFEEKGTYRLYYYVIDGSYNYEVQCFVIECE